MNIFSHHLVFFHIIILSGRKWMCIIHITVLCAEILDYLAFHSQKPCCSEPSCCSLHAHGCFLRINSQERTGWLKMRASVVRSWVVENSGAGQMEETWLQGFSSRSGPVTQEGIQVERVLSSQLVAMTEMFEKVREEQNKPEEGLLW